MKRLAEDIYVEISTPSKKALQPGTSTGGHTRSGKDKPSESMIAEAAAKAKGRSTKINSLKQLLKIEVINEEALRLLKSPAYQAYMAEKILFRLSSSTSENVAATFSRIFMTCQFSKRFIAYVYWGDDKRYVGFLLVSC